MGKAEVCPYHLPGIQGQYWGQGDPKHKGRGEQSPRGNNIGLTWYRPKVTDIRLKPVIRPRESCLGLKWSNTKG